MDIKMHFRVDGGRDTFKYSADVFEDFWGLRESLKNKIFQLVRKRTGSLLKWTLIWLFFCLLVVPVFFGTAGMLYWIGAFPLLVLLWNWRQIQHLDTVMNEAVSPLVCFKCAQSQVFRAEVHEADLLAIIQKSDIGETRQCLHKLVREDINDKGWLNNEPWHYIGTVHCTHCGEGLPYVVVAARGLRAFQE